MFIPKGFAFFPFLCSILVLLHMASPVVAFGGSLLELDSQTSELRGLVVASQEAVLSSEMAGRVVEMPFEVGDSFREGDVLVRFHCSIPKAYLQKAKAALDAVQKRLTVNRQLVELRSASRLDLQLMEAEQLQARAEVVVKQAEADQCTLLAPFAGSVAEWKVKPFESVGPGQPLLDVVGKGGYDIHIILPSHRLAEFQPGRGVTIQLEETGRSYSARVVRLGGRVDPAGQTLRVIAAMTAATGDLLPGMSGPVKVE